MVMDCSMNGYKEFSPFHAEVTMVERGRDKIINYYALAQRFHTTPGVPESWRDIVGRWPTHFEVRGIRLPVELLEAWYICIWYKHFKFNPERLDLLQSGCDVVSVEDETVLSHSRVMRGFQERGLRYAAQPEVIDLYETFAITERYELETEERRQKLRNIRLKYSDPYAPLPIPEV